MGNRIKEEERIEKMIRSLMKLPENRRCMNCNNLGPQYVCTTFSTFICTNCSGIHREFTHRVKSVSMANFSLDEVTALQAGGNERARQVLLRYWDLHSDSVPDRSNLHKLREFIKTVYIDRKYAGEKHGDTGLSRLTSEILRNNKDEGGKSRTVDYIYGSRTRYEEDLHEKTYTRRVGRYFGSTEKFYNYNLKSSPNSRLDPRNGGQTRNPVKIEVVDDRFRDDGFGSRRFSMGDSSTMLPRRLSCSDTDTKRSRPLQEILGEKFPSLRVSEASKESGTERSDCSASNQDSATKKPVEKKIEIPQSLIDFDIETEPTNAAALATSHTQKKSSPNTSGSQTPNSTGDTQASKVNTLESLLFELSVPSPVIPVDDVEEVPGTDIVIYTAPTDNNVTSGSGSGSASIPKLMDSVDTLPDQPSKDSLLLQATDDEWLFSDGSSSFSQLTSSIGSSNTVLNFSVERTKIGGFCGEELSQTATKPAHDAIPGIKHQFLREEAMPNSRMPLPVDLFTASYLSMAAPVSGLQTGLAHGMSFNYYPNTTPVPAFPNQSKSTNPFDIGNERSQFPSTASLQGAPAGSLNTSSLGIYSSQLTMPQLHGNTYMTMPQHSPYAASPFSPCGYTGQEVHNNFQTIRPQGIGGFGNGSAVFVSGQQPAALYSEPANPSSSIGGNPFG